MAYNLHTNGVVTGALNSFCLACNTFVESEEDAIKHIGTSLHTKNLSSVQYSDKFEDEHIRKFKLGYFCEFCNELLPIASKVTLHVTEDEHKQNKGIHLLKPMGRDVVAFNNIHIDEKAWHGLIEDICTICNEEFEDEAQHKSETTHSLNLVLKPVKFSLENAIYRHVDDAVQCLTCNTLITPKDLMMRKHFNDSDHQEVYAKRRIKSNGGHEQIGITVSAVANTMENKSTIDNDIKNDKKSSVKENTKILESIGKYQGKGININLETETAFCKTCSKVITFEFKEIESHIESHSSTEKVDSNLKYPSAVDQNLNRVNINDKSSKISEDLHVKKDPANENIRISEALPHSKNESDEEVTDTCSSSSAEASAYAKENRFIYNEESGHTYCRICDVRLPSSLRSMKEHVSGAAHTKMVQSSQTKQANQETVKPASSSALTKMETKIWLKSAYDIESLFSSETVVNEEYCLPKFSFWLITANNLRIRCVICDVNLPPNHDAISHVRNQQHGIKMGAVPVVTSEKSEIIREIRSGVYHCGFCNLVVSSWNDMKQHLKCNDHKEKKVYYERRLRDLIPDIREHTRQQEMGVMRLLAMLHRF